MAPFKNISVTIQQNNPRFIEITIIVKSFLIIKLIYTYFVWNMLCKRTFTYYYNFNNTQIEKQSGDRNYREDFTNYLIT